MALHGFSPSARRFLRLPTRAAGALLLLACILPGAPAIAAAQAGQAALSVADVVDSEGRAHWPDGYAGSVDIGHYDLYTAANGEPRFLPRSAPDETADIPAAEAGWSGFGAVRHGCNGPINAMLRMPNGDLILGGGFGICGNVYADGVVRWDGHRWSALSQPANLPGFGLLVVSGGVHALALRGSDVIIGAANTLIGTAEGTQYDVARWDGNAWHALVPGVKINEGSFQNLQGVRAIAVVGTDVYFGGDIFDATFDDNSPHLFLHNLARWDGSAWHAVTGTNAGCDPLVPGVDGVVNALATDGAALYVGGDFVVACTYQTNDANPGVAASHVARWNGSTWSSVGSGGENGVDGVVNALAYAGGSLYVGGAFDAAGSKQASNLARWDGAAWNPIGIGAANGVSSTVHALTVFSGKLYVSGEFKFAGAVSALRVAQWDGSNWSALAQGLGTTAAGDTSSVNAILADTHGVMAAGAITVINAGDTASGVARWSGSSWQPLVDASDFTKIDGHVNAFAVRGGDLFAGGAITRVGEVPVNNVARWNGSAWSSLGSGSGNGVDGEVFALSTTPANVYVGGAFTHAGGQAANHVARWDGGTWHAMGSGTANGVDATVRAVASGSDTSVYAGGDFIHAGGQVVNYIAAWNGSAWKPLTAANGVGVCGVVTALAAYGTGVYAGGYFPDTITGCPPGAALVGNHVSYWTGSAWNELLEPLAIVNGVNAQVTSLLVSGSDLYLGGWFYQVDTSSGALLVPRVVRWRNGAWNALGGGLNQEIVLSLGTLQGKVYAGTRSASVYRFDETTLSSWRAIDTGGFDGFPINALATVGSNLYVGGNFFEIGGFPNAASSAWALYQTPIIFTNGFEQ